MINKWKSNSSKILPGNDNFSRHINHTEPQASSNSPLDASVIQFSAAEQIDVDEC